MFSSAIMAVNGQNLEPSKYLSYQLARRSNIFGESENAMQENGNMGDNSNLAACKSASSKVCYGHYDLSPVDEKSSPFTSQKPPPHISQKSPSCILQKQYISQQSFTPPFRFARPPSMYTWVRGQSINLSQSSSLPNIDRTSPSLNVPNEKRESETNRTPTSSSSSRRCIVPSIRPNPFISNLFAAQLRMKTGITMKELFNLNADCSYSHDQDESSENLFPQSPSISPNTSTSSISPNTSTSSISPNTSTSSTSPSSALDKLFVQTENDRGDLDLNPQICSCLRPLQLILCKSCGNVLTGRIRKKCHVHSNQVFLMDMLCCAECESTNLKEISNASPSEKK